MQVHRRAFLKGLGVAAVTVAFPVAVITREPSVSSVLEGMGWAAEPAVEWDGGLLNAEQANRFIQALIKEPTLLRDNGIHTIEVKFNNRIICRAKPEDFEWV